MKAIMEKEMSPWTPEEKKELSDRYGCEIIYQRATLEQAKDKFLPSDSYIIFYRIDNETYMDVCRANKMSDLFDLYYDVFGKNSLVKIDFGYGTVNPKNWGYKVSNKKKRK